MYSTLRNDLSDVIVLPLESRQNVGVLICFKHSNTWIFDQTVHDLYSCPTSEVINDVLRYVTHIKYVTYDVRERHVRTRIGEK